MAYTLTYRLTFTDIHPVTPADWEILFNKKDGPVVDVFNLTGSAEPLTIEWSNSEEDKFSPIIGSKATVGYMYQALPGEPKPDEFIKCEEDTWLIIINKNGQLYWKGFIKPDNNNYPFLHAPFEFRMNATDYFQVMKSKTVNLDNSGLLLYDYITLGDAIQRTLFQAVEYDDSVLRVLCSIAPDAISDPGALFSELFIHTDALYDFSKGELSVYDCLRMLCEAFGARMFYAAGSYWIQRVADLDQEQYTVIRLAPADVAGSQETVVNVVRQLGTSAPQNDMYYLDRTQGIIITPALKEQEFNFKLKAINRLLNFQWAQFDGSEFNNWLSTSGLNFTRSGAGTQDSPYKLRLFTSGSSTTELIYQTLIVQPGQIIEINLECIGNYAKEVHAICNVTDGTPGQQPTDYYLKSDGSWTHDFGAFSDINVSIDKKSRKGSIKLVSVPIPLDAVPNGTLQFGLSRAYAADSVPPGETVYADFGPAFLRVYNTPYTDIEGSIANDGAYSLKPEAKEFFFLDTADENLSNTLFYDDAGTKRALPAKNWRSAKDPSIPLRDLDEYLAYGYLDAMQEAIYNIESDVFSNTLEFHNVSKCADMPGQFMLIRDKYSVRNCKHSLMIAEVKQEGTGSGVYEVTPVTND